MLYLDTSALLPYYRHEAGSEAVVALLTRQTAPVAISPLVRVEVASALARWVRMAELTEPQAHRIENAFDEDTRAGRFAVLALGAPVFERAVQWLLARKTALRTLDALHLACAEGHGAVLITRDQALAEAARYFGLDVRFPGE